MQVTFLHLFHHSSITVVVGSILPFDYNADMYLPILLNSANHTLLYLHYLLATLGLKSWWAPYITSLQLLQFCVIFGQSVVSFRAGPDCGSPDFAKVLMIVYMGSMIALFINFFLQVGHLCSAGCRKVLDNCCSPSLVFLQKYVFRRPVQSLDMCGVVKRPPNLYPNIPSQYCGIAVLDHTGSCVVVLPEDFPDEERMARELGPSRTPFCVVYSLTAMRAPMPTLHIAREVGRAPAQAAAGAAGTPSSTRATTRVPLKLSPNSATAVAGSGEKKGVSGGAGKQQAQKSRSGSGSRGQVTPSSPADLPVPHAESDRLQDRLLSLPFPPKFSNANVVKSASISDFRLLPSYNSFGDSRNSSSGNLLLHNDRLIDGPLPLSESFELINRYSQQIRTGISESIFRLTLGALATEERCHDEVEVAPKELSADAAAGAAAGDGDEPISVCGALGAEDRRGNFSGINDAGADGAGGSFFAPLTFVIAGGVAGGTVSWVVHTAPVVSSGDPNAVLGGGAGDLQSVDEKGGDGGAGQPRLRSPSRTPPVGSTGIIRSTSVGAGLEDLVLPGQQQAEYAEDYALDWRAIS
jgi:hypothetical protein